LICGLHSDSVSEARLCKVKWDMWMIRLMNYKACER